MTRCEYPIPPHLCGDRLAEELTAVGVPIDPLGVSVTGGRLVLVWDRTLVSAEIAQADAVVARHDWTEAKEDARKRELVRQRAESLATALDDPQAVIGRAGLRVAYESIREIREAVRGLVAWANTRGAGLPELGASRPWREVVRAARQIARQETDPEA